MLLFVERRGARFQTRKHTTLENAKKVERERRKKKKKKKRRHKKKKEKNRKSRRGEIRRRGHVMADGGGLERRWGMQTPATTSRQRARGMNDSVSNTSHFSKRDEDVNISLWLFGKPKEKWRRRRRGEGQQHKKTSTMLHYSTHYVGGITQ